MQNVVSADILGFEVPRVTHTQAPGEANKMHRLRVVIRPVTVDSSTVYIAQCLERNIVVRGKNPDDAVGALIEHLVQIRALVREHGAENPLEYLDEAPPDAWQAWDSGFKGQLTRIPLDGSFELEPALAYAL